MRRQAASAGPSEMVALPGPAAGRVRRARRQPRPRGPDRRAAGRARRARSQPETRAPTVPPCIGAIDQIGRADSAARRPGAGLRGDADQEIGRRRSPRSTPSCGRSTSSTARSALGTRPDQPSCSTAATTLVRSLAEKIDDPDLHPGATARSRIYTAGGEALLEYSPRGSGLRSGQPGGAGTVFGPIAIFRRASSTRAPASRSTRRRGHAGLGRRAGGADARAAERRASPMPSQQITSRVTGGPLAGPARDPRPHPARARRPAPGARRRPALRAERRPQRRRARCRRRPS